MLKIVATGIAALSMTAFAGSAMAAGPTPLEPVGGSAPDTYGVPVNIEVFPEVSVWAGPANNPPQIQLDMEGNDGNNSATDESTITYLTNVDANIRAEVNGTLPEPIVTGGGINFFLFHGVGATDAVSAISGNAYNPAGALAWNYATLGTDQELIASTGVKTSAQTDLLTYASAAPGELPLADSFDLTVTYTISANP